MNLYLKYPHKGSRTLRDVLWDDHSIHINRKAIQRLMRVMGIRSIAPQKKTSTPNKEHKVYPYLLRNLTIERPNRVWCTDITYIPMRKGFVYLVAIMDWYSRKVLSWCLSNTMNPDFCVEALEEALMHYGKPDIFNSDQGAQFTSTEFTGAIQTALY
ncbi:helix-turn-helix protein [Pleionea mediterranea]|uniref:Helix-turn-helix protein n=1 Tax=Pleionea mediterranea TaxID=523701 RepID=A0A316FQQ8_9GAMM|nr:DDE-type integrase/transposase/recombinase [Pleionea mediterranea]PWK50939.1 helix-turn-helix protein [Pleionea mediterranea]